MNVREIETKLGMARQAQRAGQVEAAARLCQEVLAVAGEHPAALNILGRQALAGDRPAAAAALFRRAITADPAAPELHMNLATALRACDDLPGERAALEGALAIDQRHFMAVVRLDGASGKGASLAPRPAGRAAGGDRGETGDYEVSSI